MLCEKCSIVLDTPQEVHEGICDKCLDKPEPAFPAQAVKGATGAETIAAREEVMGYGTFHIHAAAEQALLDAAMAQPGWERLNDVQKSAMRMIFHKQARILNGGAEAEDCWHDISGYSELAEKDIKRRKSTR